MKLINLLKEKRTFAMSVLLMFVFGTMVSGEIKFASKTAPPWIGGTSGSDSPLKKIEIITGDEQWPNGKRLHVFIAAGARGLGIGEGTLKPVTILGNDHSIWEDGTDEVGSTNPNGSWQSSLGSFVATFIMKDIPEDSEETSFDWSANGTVKLTPYVWQVSVSNGVSISLPVALQGSYSTSGTWITDSTRSTTRSAVGTSGTHTVDVRYYCSSCNIEGNTKEAIGGKEAHAKVTCSREGCDGYRECDTAAKALHSLCEGCNEYRCNGESHIQKNCSSAYFGSMLIYSCGQPYWACASDASNHTSWSYCGSTNSLHGYKHCVSSNHTIQASCFETDENGNTCTVTGFYPCEYHTHQYPTGSGSQNGNNGDDQNGNNGDGQNGNNGDDQNGNNGDGNTGNTGTDSSLCPAPDCNVRLNNTNRSEHALVTCTGSSKKSCKQEYYKCQADDHKWLYCQRGSDCPYFTNYQSRYRIRRCMESNNVSGCITVNGKRQPHNVQ